MIKSVWSAALPSLLTFAAMAASAQGTGLTLSGIDATDHLYGSDADQVWTTVVPAVFRYETGPVTLRVNVPYMRTHGTHWDSGAAGGSPSERQPRLGDATVSGFYSLFREGGAGVGLDLGLKANLVTPGRSRDPVAAGKEDYSLPDLALQADLYKSFGAVSAFGTLGYAWKGDTRFRERRLSAMPLYPAYGESAEADLHSPWYVSIGGSYRLTQETSLGLTYDWRRKLLDDSDNVSEATLFMTHKLTPRWRLQGYGLVGFSDASPGWGLGAALGYGF
jgi:hypothetical protein